MLGFLALIFAALFSVGTAWVAGGMKWAARRSNVLFAGKINSAIDLSSPKVVNNLEIKAGEKCVVCRCWKSGKFPLCDGSHVKHNEATGDNVGYAHVLLASFVCCARLTRPSIPRPAIVAVQKE